MTTKRKICIISGTRADYGLLSPLLKQIKQDPALSLQVIATGTHLSPEFGLTYKEIENDGFVIDKKLEIAMSSDSAIGVGKAMGLGLISFSEAYDSLQPDLIVILGDRYEMLAAASAALVAKIPIAHISGGEITEGAYDNSIRHALTKLSHLHFTSSEPYRQRVIQMGEHPGTVFNVGSPSIDNIKNTKLLSKKEFEKVIEKTLLDKNILITYHPETLAKSDTKQQFQVLLNALNKLDDTFMIFTYPNSDNEGRIIIDMIQQYCNAHPDNTYSTPSLGRVNYLSALQYVDGVIGNSSSGIVEVPSFKIGTINIGDRQKGRLRAPSIIDCPATSQAITKALEQLYSPEFQAQLKTTQNLFGSGNACEQIKNTIKSYNLQGILQKKFYDIT